MTFDWLCSHFGTHPNSAHTKHKSSPIWHLSDSDQKCCTLWEISFKAVCIKSIYLSLSVLHCSCFNSFARSPSLSLFAHTLFVRLWICIRLDRLSFTEHIHCLSLATTQILVFQATNLKLIHIRRCTHTHSHCTVAAVSHRRRAVHSNHINSSDTGLCKQR